jgi:hypothetical protein
MLLRLVFKQVSDDRPANRTQKTVVFLVSEVITCGSTSKRSSKSTVALEVFCAPG